jgi:hypothetical protein
VFNYSLYHTFGLDDTAVAGKTTTEATTLYNQHDNNAILQIRSSKQTYRPGETVVIAITNNGKYPLEFPDSILGLTNLIYQDSTKGWIDWITSNISTKAKRIKKI